MLQETLKFYLGALLVTILITAALSTLYVLGTLARNQDKSTFERQTKVLDVLLVNVLILPILSFATLSVMIVLRSR